MHPPEVVFAIIGAICGYQIGIHTALMRLGRSELRSRRRAIGRR